MPYTWRSQESDQDVVITKRREYDIDSDAFLRLHFPSVQIRRRLITPIGQIIADLEFLSDVSNYPTLIKGKGNYKITSKEDQKNHRIYKINIRLPSELKYVLEVYSDKQKDTKKYNLTDADITTIKGKVKQAYDTLHEWKNNNRVRALKKLNEALQKFIVEYDSITTRKLNPPNP